MAAGVEAGEVIRLSLPAGDQRFLPVARIVVGGLATRLNLPYESLDDLQLAVEAVLANGSYSGGQDVTVELVLRDRAVEVLIAPLDTRAVEADLGADVNDDAIGLRRLLDAVVDGVGFEEREGERWLRLEKQLPTKGA